MHAKGEVMESSGRKEIGHTNPVPTIMEQIRAGTRRAIPNSPPKKKQSKNPTMVRVR